MRRAFVESLTVLADHNPWVVFLTGDLGFQVFDEFQSRFGPRYINVGIAEAQMACAAAGLAMEGFRPFVYSIASFMTGRAFEQIRVSIAYPGHPVVVVGAGGGFCYSNAGVTHHAAEDLALMSLLPGMTVVAPGDPNEVKQLLPQLLEISGPSYIRIGKFGEPTYEAPGPAVLGRARLLIGGEKVALLTTGEMAPVVLSAVRDLQAEGVHPSVYQFHTVKPLDRETLDRLAGSVKTLIVAEESTPVGGLASAVMAWHVQQSSRVRLVRLGPPDQLALGSPRRETLRQRFGYGPEAIRQACRKAWREDS